MPSSCDLVFVMTPLSDEELRKEELILQLTLETIKRAVFERTRDMCRKIAKSPLREESWEIVDAIKALKYTDVFRTEKTDVIGDGK